MMDRVEKTFVPGLRFPEYVSRWNETVLSNVAKVIDCKHRTPPYVDDGIPVVSPGSISWGKLDLISPTKKVSIPEYESLMDHCVPKYGDLVFSRNQSMGVASYVENDTKFVLGQDTVLIQSEIDSFFTYYHLQTKNTQNQISRLSGGSTFSRINLGDIRKLKLFFPNEVAEQRKIVAFLEAVDAKLEALRRKRALLAEYKRGVMQKLFTQEIRFVGDDGRPFADWETVRLGEVAEIITGKTPRTNEKSNWNGTVPFVTPTDINNNKYQSETARKVSAKAAKKILPPNSILYTCIASIGKMSIITSPSISNQQINALIPDLCIVHHEFLYYSLLHNTPRIKRFGAITTLPIINKSDFSSIKIYLPISKAEQKKIADFLTAIDNKITAVDQQIEQIETFKKGLLQQMFV